jgi:hypothetical protein
VLNKQVGESLSKRPSAVDSIETDRAMILSKQRERNPAGHETNETLHPVAGKTMETSRT